MPIVSKSCANCSRRINELEANDSTTAHDVYCWKCRFISIAQRGLRKRTNPALVQRCLVRVAAAVNNPNSFETTDDFFSFYDELVNRFGRAVIEEAANRSREASQPPRTDEGVGKGKPRNT